MLLLFWLKLPFSVDRNLYIIGGQRGEYFNDFFAINVDTLTVNFLTDRVSSGLLQFYLAAQKNDRPSVIVLTLLCLIFKKIIYEKNHQN